VGFIRKVRLGNAGRFAVSAIVLAQLALAPAALAGTGGAVTPAGAPPPPPSNAGTPSSTPSAGTLTLEAVTVAPRKSFYFGYHYASIHFTLASTQPENDIVVNVLNSAGEVVKTYYVEDAVTGQTTIVRWDGSTNEGKPARNGRYRFQVLPQTTAPVARTRVKHEGTGTEAESLGFNFFAFAFPVLGAHEFAMGEGRFGAPRSGHTHQGQDVMAACGTPLVAARGGRVQFAGFQSAAGNYLVIDGRGSPYDLMYAHLAEPSPLKTGDVVHTGQPIGIVGETGDATACHLHFEMWSAPGWYEGGSPFDPLPYLEQWDKYS
jgi:murein DD-endopeptidase MepM/ murein hydrolase activator NlpD